jgi:hypothetical protein
MKLLLLVLLLALVSIALAIDLNIDDKGPRIPISPLPTAY